MSLSNEPFQRSLMEAFVGLPDLVVAAFEDLFDGLRAGAFFVDGLRVVVFFVVVCFVLAFDSAALEVDFFEVDFAVAALDGVRAGALEVFFFVVDFFVVFLVVGALEEVAFLVVFLVVFFVVVFFEVVALVEDFLVTFFFEVVRLLAVFFDEDAFDPAFLDVVFREEALVVFFLDGDLLAAAFLATANSRRARHLHLSL
ncbi:MAG: hypothetical protein ACF8MJ_01710 [Phycisphaerales bacterium JB050]